METFEILMIGTGTGMALSLLSIAIINSGNAEQYPLGGFMPAIWMVFDLGGSSQLIEGGFLVMGGMLGYYLVLAIWRGRPDSLGGLFPEQRDSSHIPHEITGAARVSNAAVITGKKLADFL